MSNRQATWSLLAVGLAGFALPQVLAGRWLGLAIDAVIFGLLALSIGALIRQSGMISLGHAAFYGASGYVVAIATTRWGWDLHAAVLAGLAASAALAAVVGAVAVRLPGISLAMVTLAFAQGLHLLIVQPDNRDVTGGLDGMRVTTGDGLLWLDGPELGGDSFWPLAWGAYLAVVVGIHVLRRSRFGVRLEAIRENEERVRFCGLRTWWPRVAAFGLSGAVAGLAGALFAVHNTFVSPSTVYWVTTAFALVAALAGGVASLAGPLVGAALYTMAQDRFATSGGINLYIGLAFMIVVAVAPSGLSGQVGRLRAWVGTQTR